MSTRFALQPAAAAMEQAGPAEMEMRAEPRAAAAAEPHKRRAVAAGTAGETVEGGGKPPAGTIRRGLTL